ncbi:MAG: molybdopterin molybdotransferase MoeA [Thermoplasmataceae archaeon]
MAEHRRKMERFERLVTFDDAIKKMLSVKWQGNVTELIPAGVSFERVSASTVQSNINVPTFDRSAVDGYAVMSTDLSGSSKFSPVTLSVRGNIEAGYTAENEINRGSCYEIYTGGRLPKGADAVVMAEDSSRNGDSVEILEGVRKFENVSRTGEDIEAGQILLEKGQQIRAQHVASMIAAGIKEVDVYSKLVMGILSTGNELLDSGSNVANTTQPLLLNYFRTGYMETVNLGVVRDDIACIKEKILTHLDQFNLIVITGGTSLGRKDVVPDVLDNIGHLIFGGVRIKPGRTISLYEVSGKPVFSVSGLPVAALISLEAFLPYFLNQVISLKNTRISINARISERVANRDSMRSYLRVRLRNTESGLIAEPLRITGSGILSSLLKANGITVIPENVEGIEEGETVSVSVIGDVF